MPPALPPLVGQEVHGNDLRSAPLLIDDIIRGWGPWISHLDRTRQGRPGPTLLSPTGRTAVPGGLAVAVPCAMFDRDGTLVDQAAAARTWARWFAKA